MARRMIVSAGSRSRTGRVFPAPVRDVVVGPQNVEFNPEARRGTKNTSKTKLNVVVSKDGDGGPGGSSRGSSGSTIQTPGSEYDPTIILVDEQSDAGEAKLDCVHPVKNGKAKVTMKPLERPEVSEVMVFGPRMRPDVADIDWLDSTDEINVEMRLYAPRALDVAIWLFSEAKVDCEQGKDFGGLDTPYVRRALQHVAYANRILREQDAAIYLRVRDEFIYDMTDVVKSNSKRSRLLRNYSWGDVDSLELEINGLETDKRYNRRMVNIFYAGRINNDWGDGRVGTDRACEEAFIALGDHAMADLLLHEVGHLCGLQHTDEGKVAMTYPHLPKNNFMSGRALNRSTITTGQLARMHFSTESFLNRVYQITRGRKRHCDDLAHDPQSLRLDFQRNAPGCYGGGENDWTRYRAVSGCYPYDHIPDPCPDNGEITLQTWSELAVPFADCAHGTSTINYLPDNRRKPESRAAEYALTAKQLIERMYCVIKNEYDDVEERKLWYKGTINFIPETKDDFVRTELCRRVGKIGEYLGQFAIPLNVSGVVSTVV